MSDLQYIVKTIAERAPGPGDNWFTVSRDTMWRIPWNNLVDPPIQRVICDELDAVSRFDESGNYQFQLTKDAARSRTRKEIRELLRHRLPILQSFDREGEDERIIDRIMEIVTRENPR